MPLKLSKNLVKLRHSRSRMFPLRMSAARVMKCMVVRRGPLLILSEGPFTGTDVKLVPPRPPDSARELCHEVDLLLKTTA